MASAAGREDLAKIFMEAEEARKGERVSPVAGAIRRLRAALDCTQTQLAALADISVSTVARAETSTMPEAEVLKKLAAVARKHQLADIAEILDQAQIPDFFVTPERWERVRLRKNLLAMVDRLDSYQLEAIGTILSIERPQEDEPISGGHFDEVPSLKEVTQRQAVEEQALTMIQAAAGLTYLIDPSETAEAYSLCAAAWVLGNERPSSEFVDLLTINIKRVLGVRGYPLTETELEMLGPLGARASVKSDILALAQELHRRIERVSNAQGRVPPPVRDVVKHVRRMLAGYSSVQFADVFGLTVDQLDDYESGRNMPELRTLLLLRKHLSGLANQCELLVIREAVLLEFARMAEGSEDASE